MADIKDKYEREYDSLLYKQKRLIQLQNEYIVLLEMNLKGYLPFLQVYDQISLDNSIKTSTSLQNKIVQLKHDIEWLEM